MKTRVHITVDTEFNIAGAFSDAVNCRPVGPQSVYCRTNEQSHGLGYLLDTLNRFGHKGTFFVEALNTIYFGDEPMGGIAKSLHASGHDVQLHLHPCWTYFRHEDWASRLQVERPNDNICRRTEDEIVELIQHGLAAFNRWGIPAPTVLRTGGLKVNEAVYRAMGRCGLLRASNVGVGIYRPDDSSLQLYAGNHDVEHVLETPVTTYTDFTVWRRRHLKCLTLTGSSWPEIRTVLLQARRSGLSDVVLLTHPFEFVKHRDRTYEKLFPDRINRDRLLRLCDYLAGNAEFEVATMGAPAPTLRKGQNPLLRTPVRYALPRMVANAVNHAVMRF